MDQTEVDNSFYALHTAFVHKRVKGLSTWKEFFYLLNTSGVTHTLETYYPLDQFAKKLHEKFVVESQSLYPQEYSNVINSFEHNHVTEAAL